VKRPDLSRAWLAVVVLVLALLAGWWLNRASEPEAPPPAPAPAANPVPPPARTIPPSQQAANPPEAPAKVVDIFAVRTWEPPPPPLAAFVPPPQAPPLPFRFMGRIAEPGTAPEFLLLQGDRVLRVKAGERVGGDYRLEKFEGGKLYFRYRPLNVEQTLPVGTAQ
jgi:hypothetical protein